MSKNRKPFSSGLSDALDDAFAASVTGKVGGNTLDATAPDKLRWYFLNATFHGEQSSFNRYAEYSTLTWVRPYDGYWSDLATRHRACQLMSSLLGTEFVRWLASIDLNTQVGDEWGTFLQDAPLFVGFNPTTTNAELALRFLDTKTTVKDLNAHVLQRDLLCFIPFAPSPVTVPELADATFAVTVDVLSELQIWARTGLFKGADAYLNPHMLDTKRYEVEKLRALTGQEAQNLRGPRSQGGDPEMQARLKTLERRSRLTRASFFAQATKRGVDRL